MQSHHIQHKKKQVILQDNKNDLKQSFLWQNERFTGRKTFLQSFLQDVKRRYD